MAKYNSDTAPFSISLMLFETLKQQLRKFFIVCSCFKATNPNMADARDINRPTRQWLGGISPRSARLRCSKKAEGGSESEQTTQHRTQMGVHTRAWGSCLFLIVRRLESSAYELNLAGTENQGKRGLDDQVGEPLALGAQVMREPATVSEERRKPCQLTSLSRCHTIVILWCDERM